MVRLSAFYKSIFRCALAALLSGIFAFNTIAQSAKNRPKTAPDQDFMYQYSIIDALMAGVFDGDLTIGQLKKKGDFGVGTFNRVDGELLIDKGHVYKISYDGSVKEVPDSDSTSAAFVKFFKADTVIHLNGPGLNYEKVQEQIRHLLNPNGIYALRISATFPTMTTRAEKPASKPYSSLPEHLKHNQIVFELKNTKGICSGFLLPPYLARTNVPGFHLHYLADDHKSGGHIFNFTADAVTVEVDMAKGFTIENNTNAEFGKVNLQPDRGAELKKIE
ncbi:acetolactate decarboxylase [Dyadobacter sp. BE34]|uniref:Alpha-acetolactate decarboxylase n=1 Tax=Dyadobacter fermentans TaxID=94254 RepID=A0ABU1R5X9_9BACT|nr:MULTISPECIES: acetolactate decarboxylase [Dyadobacter]MDR6808816.1 acetolactate decarboxylase [Dyadobacter fermentans]MDR7046559.1 acetolactate decarboxylase [Dyadobacter sp. BE242]MDR7200872.1 acetolactate decarboxylase [Dyadobacter sp. BE34]MDR7218832.1 acetolactate decarboxylase [Dyadobacter sp. BE31]MDR7266762.1 acetolactate decarboxylase [Dyadobacter sp. BE32]